MTVQLLDEITRDGQALPALAAIAAARNASVNPEAPARSIAIVVSSAEGVVSIAEGFYPAIQFTKAFQL